MGSVISSSIQVIFSFNKYSSIKDEPHAITEPPVHQASRVNDWKKLAQLLRDEEWWDGVNTVNGRAETPLHIASAEGHIECAVLLVDYGADSTVTDRAGMTPLHHAVTGGHSEVMDLLTKAHGFSSLNMKDNWGWTPLHRALINSHYETSYVLLEYGCTVNEGDKTKRTALHVAASYGHIRTASLLVAKGADVDYQDQRGWTPLMLAVVGEHLQVVRDLIHKGCEVNLKNDDGNTALHLCCKGLTIAKHKCALELINAGAECSEINGVLEDFLMKLSQDSTTSQRPNGHQVTTVKYALTEGGIQLITILVRAAGSLPASLASQAIWWREHCYGFDRSSVHILHLISTSATLSMLRSATKTFLMADGKKGENVKVPPHCPSLKDIARCFSRQHLSTIHGNVMCAVDKVKWLPHGIRELLVMNDV